LFYGTPIISFMMHTFIFPLHKVPYFLWFLHKTFGRLLGPGSFDSLERPLTRKQVSVLITFDGVGLISTSTITPTTYLRSWALVTLVIPTRFMVDQHPFLLEALTRVDNNTSRRHVIFYHPQAMHVFFHLNNSSSNKWFNFKIPSQSIRTIILFLACSSMGHLRPIVPEFYHVLT